MSASANTMLADLPPSSSVTRLIVCAAPAAIERPTSVEPVNATLATSGCSTSRAPDRRCPGPATTLTTPSGMPASSAIRSNSSAVSGVSSAGLSTTVLPAASAGAELPRGDRQREVPRRDQRHDAERLAERHRHAARDRDRVARGCARAPRRSSGTCRRPCPSRRARRRSACRRCAPRAPPAPPARSASASASRCSSRARSAGRDRPPRRVRRLGARDGRVGVLDAGARQLRQDLLGRRLDDGEGHAGAGPCGGSVGSTGSSSTMPAASSHSIVAHRALERVLARSPATRRRR